VNALHKKKGYVTFANWNHDDNSGWVDHEVKEEIDSRFTNHNGWEEVDYGINEASFRSMIRTHVRAAGIQNRQFHAVNDPDLDPSEKRHALKRLHRQMQYARKKTDAYADRAFDRRYEEVELDEATHRHEDGDRVLITYGRHEGKRGYVTDTSPSGDFHGVSSKPDGRGKHFGDYHASDLKPAKTRSPRNEETEISEAKSPSAKSVLQDRGHYDSVGKDKTGHLVVRRGYFYRNGGDSEKLAASVSRHLTDAGIKHTVVDHGDHWAPFRGGASTRNSSHWWAKVKIHEGVDEARESIFDTMARVNRENKAKRIADRAAKRKSREGDVDRVMAHQRSLDDRMKRSGAKPRKVKGYNEENLDELSKGTLGKYVQSARHELDEPKRRWPGYATAVDIASRKYKNRRKGVDRASKMLTREEAQIDEISKRKLLQYIPKAVSNHGDWRSVQYDFDLGHDEDGEHHPGVKKYVDNRHRGVTLAAAKLAGHKNSVGGRARPYKARVAATEEAQIDELSTKTLKSYFRKGTTSLQRAWTKQDREEDKAMSTDGNKYPEKQKRHMDNAQAAQKVWQKRNTGLDRAADALDKRGITADHNGTFRKKRKA
jgi:hypothetical protein